ncbi:FtsX-like permease family protein [Propioniciclava coleopterorum]|uniref:FtsX-like permease family protein n=1 Tax=Propioniciclava coleopterorum TaxID=2714937 RepID=A0A6G7Y7F6_9ACTN|nr:FtsX-like permease family protein [Propioniciclava coleopterorum]QIK72824.1 FtsX-like permease family protein [Propioniciclava coleopterorum]
MLREPRRLISSSLAILLGVAFTCATLLLGGSLSRSYADQVAGRAGDAAVVVDGTRSAGLPTDVPAAIAAVPGVTATRPLVSGSQVYGSPQFYLMVETLPAQGGTHPIEGRMPAAPGEVVINEAMAKTGKVGVGATLTWADAPASTVVGIVKVASDASASPGQPLLLGPNETILPLVGDFYAQVMVAGTGDPQALADAIAAVPQVKAAEARTVTAATWIADLVEDFTVGTQIVTAVLLTFGVIAFFVAALVISNTFAILVAQRTRQLALLRCLGASRGQTFRQVIGEAALTAAVAGVLGLGVGVGLTALLPVFAPDMFSAATVVPDPVSLVVPWLAGIAVTVLAAIVPARAATRVAPLAALRPTLEARSGRPIGATRTVIGALALLAGAALLAYGGVRHELPFGLAGGVVSFTGVLLLAPWWIPAMARLLGTPFRGTVVGRLAAENTRRNPRRAAATAGALLIGTTLVTMVLTGSSVAQATIDEANARRYPAEVMIAGTLTPDVADKVRAVEGVAAARQVPTFTTGIEGGTKPDFASVLGVTDQDVAALGWSGLSGLRDDEVALDAGNGITQGSRLRLVAADESRVDVVARIVPQATLTAVTPALLKRLAPEATEVLLVKLSPGADASATLGALGTALADHPGLEVASAQGEKEMLASVFNTLLLVVLALLAVSVLISLVGVGNTLGLSVLERGRETALLRALGLDRAAVGRMLGGEALLLAAVAAVSGIALGIAYGLAGVGALLVIDMPIVVRLPWLQLALVAALTLGCAWLASMLPARRAAAVPPAAALAQE